MWVNSMKNKKNNALSLTIILSLLALVVGVVCGYFIPKYLNNNAYLKDLSLPKNKDAYLINNDVVLNNNLKFDNNDYELSIEYYDLDGKKLEKIDNTKLSEYIVKYSLNEENIKIEYISVIKIVEKLFDDLEITLLMLDNDKAGDSIYIKAGDIDILIDAGSTKSSFSYISSYLDGVDGTTHSYCEDGILEYVIATHADKDHIVCFPDIFEKYECKTIIDFARSDKDTEVYKNYLDARSEEVKNGAVHYTALECFNEENGAKRIYELGDGITMEILYNYYYDHDSSGNENLYSVCTLFKRGEDQFLLTGDLEAKGEKYLVERYPDLGHCYFYKSGHHGSYTGSTLDLLNLITPDVVACSCVAFTTEYTKDLDNVFPSKATIENYVKANVKHFYVTSQKADNDKGWLPANGNITIYGIGDTLGVKCSNSNEDFYNTDAFPIFSEYRTWDNK